MGERLGAGGLDDRITEDLAPLVLLELHLEPEQASDEAIQARLGLAPAVDRGAELRQRGQQVRGDGIHHMLGVPLDHRHHRLDTVERVPLRLAGDDRDEIALAEGAEDPLDLIAARQPQLARRVDPHLGLLEQVAHEPGDMRVQPRDARRTARRGSLRGA